MAVEVDGSVVHPRWWKWTKLLHPYGVMMVVLVAHSSYTSMHSGGGGGAGAVGGGSRWWCYGGSGGAGLRTSIVWFRTYHTLGTGGRQWINTKAVE